MPRPLAGTLVFVTSAAVLVLETLAGRLLAPYVGVTLETFTAIIGTALAGIALGTWIGGSLADRTDPRRLLGPQLVLGGVLTLLAVPVIRSIGPSFATAEPSSMLILALSSVFLPACALSTVPPAVVKASLADLGETGRVVGRLSGLGTAGALFGTFVTGFLLVAALPTPAILTVLGLVLVVGGTALWIWLRRQGGQDLALAALVPLLVVGAGGTALTLTVDGPCEKESAYFCARVLEETDPARPDGRVLALDTLEHSYVDLADPTHLEFSYTRLLASAIDVTSQGPLDAVHIGGGGFTMPRWLAATRPGSTGVVLELDPVLVDLARDELGLVTGDDLQVRVGDGRLGVRDLPADSADVVIGDAFGGVAVPWHLTTREFTGQIADVLRPDGHYLINVIDRYRLRFLRAELATVRQVFPEVAVVSLPRRFEGAGGNFVVIAGAEAVDADALVAAAADHGLEVVVLAGGELDGFIGGAQVLTDDFAPVDQLLQSG